MKTISELDEITLPTEAGGSRVRVKSKSRKRFLVESAKTFSLNGFSEALFLARVLVRGSELF